MSARPKVSVIFPTYNRCDVVRTTIEHLLAQDYPADRLEIIAADNSADDTPAMVLEMADRAASSGGARVILDSSDERLPAVKRNRSLRRAEGDLVIFLNDDLWVRPDFVAAHVGAHEARTEPAAVVGHVEQSAKMPPTAFIEWYRPFAYHEISDRAGQEVSYRYHWSMNLSLPRSVMIQRNLLFHEDWAEIGHEDIELGYRWSQAGYPIIYEPAAWGEHYHPHTLDSACRLQASIGRGLRDLEALIDEPDLLERYGVLSRRSSPRAMLRGSVRTAMFNRVTVPPLQRRLAAQGRRSSWAEWCYWKVMLHHTQRGYAEASPRAPRPTPTRPVAASEVSR